jgi:hypothetical protein
VTHDNFDEWFASDKKPPFITTSYQDALRKAWEAGWEAGKLHGESCEVERRAHLDSLG